MIESDWDDDLVWLNIIEHGLDISKDIVYGVLKSEFPTKAGHNRGHGLQETIMLTESSGDTLEVVDLPGNKGAHLWKNFPND